MRVRLRTILVIVLTNLVIILLSVFVGTSYARDNIKSYTEADMLVVADIADRFVSLEIRNLKYQIEDAANVLTLSNTATLHDQLTQASKKHSEFIGLSIMDNNGSVIADTGKAPASKALLNNEYIQKAFIGETSLSSTVPTNDGVKFYLATPVPNSANHILVATLDGLYFSDLTSEYTIWKTGHIFIDDNQGNVIANVRHEWVQNRQNFIEQAKDDPSSEPIAVVINKVINKERGIAYYSINNDERVCAFTPIAGSAEGWAYCGAAIGKPYKRL